MIFFSRRVFSLPLEINLEIRILSQLKLKSASTESSMGYDFISVKGTTGTQKLLKISKKLPHSEINLIT